MENYVMVLYHRYGFTKSAKDIEPPIVDGFSLSPEEEAYHSNDPEFFSKMFDGFKEMMMKEWLKRRDTDV